MPRGSRLRSYKQIRAEIAKLEREADAARQAESAAAVTKLKKLIAQYGLTAADIGLEASGASGQRAKPAAKRASAKRAAKKATRPGAGVPKYRDPKSGRTWTGFGRAPDWIASAKNREAFRIEATDAQPPAVPPRAEPEPVPPAAKADAEDGREDCCPEDRAVREALCRCQEASLCQEVRHPHCGGQDCVRDRRAVRAAARRPRCRQRNAAGTRCRDRQRAGLRRPSAGTAWKSAEVDALCRLARRAAAPCGFFGRFGVRTVSWTTLVG